MAAGNILVQILDEQQTCQIYYAMYEIQTSSGQSVKFKCAADSDQIFLDIKINNE